MNDDEANDLLNARYGTPKTWFSRKLFLTLGVVALIFLSIFIAWASLFSPHLQVEGSTIGYSIVDDRHVTVTADIKNSGELPVRCAFQALDDSFTIIGWKEISYPGVRGSQRDVVSLRTERPAVSANVKECWTLHQ